MHRDLGGRSGEADARQRPARALAAPFVRGLVGDRARHGRALVQADLALARAIGASLIDIIVQIQRCGC